MEEEGWKVSYRAHRALRGNLEVKYWRGLKLNQKRGWSWWPVVGTADKRGYIGKKPLGVVRRSRRCTLSRFLLSVVASRYLLDVWSVKIRRITLDIARPCQAYIHTPQKGSNRYVCFCYLETAAKNPPVKLLNFVVERKTVSVWLWTVLACLYFAFKTLDRIGKTVNLG